MEAAPTIWDIYSAAKRLLVLQPRIDNRTLRESCKNVQQSITCGKTIPSTESHLLKRSSIDLAPSSTGSVDSSVSPSSMDSSKHSIESASSYGSTIRPPNSNTASNDTIKTNSTSNLTKGLINQSKNHQNGEIDMVWDFNLDQIQNNQNENELNNFNSRNIKPQQISSSFPNSHSSIQPQPIQSRPITTNNNNNTSSSFNSRNSSFNSLTQLSTSASALQKKKPASSSNSSNTECFNCHTQKTPLWRRDTNGNTLCNACGLFQKLHGTMRPLSLKTDVIKKRNSRRSSVSVNNDKKVLSNLEKNISMYTPTSNSNSPNSPSNSLNSQSQSNQQQRYKNVLILPKPIAPAPSVTTTTNIKPKIKNNSPLESTNTPSPITMPSPISPSVSSTYIHNPSLTIPVSISNSSLPTMTSSTSLTQSFNSKRIPQNFQRNSFTNSNFSNIPTTTTTNMTTTSSSVSSSNLTKISTFDNTTVLTGLSPITTSSKFDNNNNNTNKNGGEIHGEITKNNTNFLTEGGFINPNNLLGNINDNDLVMEDSGYNDLDWLKFDV